MSQQDAGNGEASPVLLPRTPESAAPRNQDVLMALAALATLMPSHPAQDQASSDPSAPPTASLGPEDIWSALWVSIRSAEFYLNSYLDHLAQLRRMPADVPAEGQGTDSIPFPLLLAVSCSQNGCY